LKTLHIVRHAKSDWSLPGQHDFDRGLNPRGLRDAPAMAERFASLGYRPDLLVSSPAVRAISTARFFAKALNMDSKEIMQNLLIYEAAWDTLLQVVNAWDDRFHEIAMFGHNPGFSQLATYLSGDMFEMPTCAIVSLQFEFDSWQMVSKKTGRIVQFDFPKKLL
jgi:phosphohistidine phosphatase